MAWMFTGTHPAQGNPVSEYQPDRRYRPPHLRPGGNVLTVPIPRTERPRIRLVVTADDFGVNLQRTKGILEGARCGAISQAQLLVNGECPEYAVSEARKLTYPLSLGLHLNLTEGTPLVPKGSLVVQGAFRGKFGLREALAEEGTIQREDVVQEVRAQMEKFKALTGSYPTHVDGHHHIHVHPMISSCIAPLLEGYGVRSVRLPREFFPQRLQEDFHRIIHSEASEAAAVFKAHHLAYTDGFVGMYLMGFENNLDKMYETIVSLGASAYKAQRHMVVEMMTHVGYPATPPKDGTRRYEPFHYDAFSENSARQYELALYASAEWKTLLQMHQYPVVSMSSVLWQAAGTPSKL